MIISIWHRKRILMIVKNASEMSRDFTQISSFFSCPRDWKKSVFVGSQRRVLWHVSASGRPDNGYQLTMIFNFPRWTIETSFLCENFGNRRWGDAVSLWWVFEMVQWFQSNINWTLVRNVNEKIAKGESRNCNELFHRLPSSSDFQVQAITRFIVASDFNCKSR